MNPTFKAKITYYRFNCSNPEELKAYKDLRRKLKEMGHVLFDSISPNHSKFRESLMEACHEQVTLETKYLFNNQWNTEEGFRVFDWAENIFPNKKIKEGYYLEIPEEAFEYKNDRTRCHYCGEVSKLSEIKNGHCPKCDHNDYLVDLSSRSGAFKFHEVKNG